MNVAIGAFEHVVTGEAPDNLDTLTKARVVLVQNVNAYLTYLRTNARPSPTTANEMRWKDAYNHGLELRRNYSEHITRFSTATIRTEWPAYQQSCQTLIVALRHHIRGVSALDPIN